MHELYPHPLFPKTLSPQAAASLSLQFSIQELLAAFQWVQEMETMVLQNKDISAIYLLLKKVLPSPHLFSPKKDFLQKLYFYARILSENSSLSQVEPILASLNALNLLMQKLQTDTANKPPPSLFPPLLQWIPSFRKIKTHLADVFHNLFPYLQEFHQDENLLFLLIEQKDLLNQYLGDQTVEAILARLFPEGASALRETLYNGYARREFLEFYARHKNMIESIDWETPCSLCTPKPPS